jgi:hypothetical protein
MELSFLMLGALCFTAFTLGLLAGIDYATRLFERKTYDEATKYDES